MMSVLKDMPGISVRIFCTNVTYCSRVKFRAMAINIVMDPDYRPDDYGRAVTFDSTFTQPIALVAE